MNCEWVRENILLAVYGELADDARHELEQHVARCGECGGDFQAAREFHALLAQSRAEEPSPNLIAASRLRLQEALETAEQGGLWARIAFDPAKWLREVRFSPALASVILIVGFAGGLGTAYKVFDHASTNASEGANGASSEASITGIRSIAQEPGSNRIEIKYDTVSTQQAEGSLNDQRIQQLLLYALRYDSNPGIRLKALDGLGSFVKDDVRVRDVVLEALVNDANPGVRTEALRLIEPVKADGSVRGVLMALAAKDQSAYIKSQARTMLAQLPEID
jgi:hypothetical protein